MDPVAAPSPQGGWGGVKSEKDDHNIDRNFLATSSRWELTYMGNGYHLITALCNPSMQCASI